MGKCMICGVETIGNICRRCEEHNRQEWCRDYERRAVDSPQRNSLAGQYRRDIMRKGGSRFQL
ncbi:hypothetical protein [Halocella sp. SP3-1]|uniref:hypothetical protein n=1 Tax=Halocella sp. SP3-1 TaxID=2382161 RepID=UPI000F7642C2|nr:hypothetical protein [Halocella sp. SP3-1]AZO95246.1 hypothetical protein D7D81_11965 [Halocella sp. SP3-1]